MIIAQMYHDALYHIK